MAKKASKKATRKKSGPAPAMLGAAPAPAGTSPCSCTKRGDEDLAPDDVCELGALVKQIARDGRAALVFRAEGQIWVRTLPC